MKDDYDQSLVMLNQIPLNLISHNPLEVPKNWKLTKNSSYF